MTRMRFGEAIDAAVAEAMARDDRIVVFGEDVPMLRAPLLARFGADRVLGSPISEAAFAGAAAGAAMAGLRPIVEIMMADFLPVAMDAIVNHMAKLETFSGGTWPCPVVVRVACGAGYGDGGQHGQALWGMLAHVPGLEVVVPSTPADAAGLMRAAIERERPVIFFEHKLLSEGWLEFLGRGGRSTVAFDVPEGGAEGEVAVPIPAVEIGRAAVRREGTDVTIAGVAVAVHRAISAAERLAANGISCEVIDLRSLRPLDTEALAASVRKTGRLVVVDEDYREHGLSGELAAVALEAGLSFRFGRVSVEETLPYARALERAALPNAERIAAAVEAVVLGPRAVLTD